MEEYVRILNSLESRKGKKPLDINNVIYWFKNTRAAVKRAQVKQEKQFLDPLYFQKMPHFYEGADRYYLLKIQVSEHNSSLKLNHFLNQMVGKPPEFCSFFHWTAKITISASKLFKFKCKFCSKHSDNENWVIILNDQKTVFQDQ